MSEDSVVVDSVVVDYPSWKLVKSYLDLLFALDIINDKELEDWTIDLVEDIRKDASIVMILKRAPLL